MNNIDLNNIDLLKDPKFYLEQFCRIKTKEKGLQPFTLNECQKDLFNTIKNNNRIMLLKARQLGCSTGVIGYFYVDTIFTPGITTGFIAYNKELCSEFLDKVKTFMNYTPAELRPQVKYNSKSEISFPKIDSKIIILPSSENAGRGYTFQRLLVSELSSWDKAEEKMMSLEASVPVNGKIVVESTPRGRTDLYYRMWSTDNGYVKKEYGWQWGYSREQIEKIRKRMNNEQLFSQEYGLNFLTSGRPVFNQKALKKQEKNVLNVGDNNDGFIVSEDNGWVIYKGVESDGIYVLGGDSAEGSLGGDYSVATIFDRRTGEEVAFFRDIISPDKFGEKINYMGRRFNNALAAVEVNSSGLLTLTTLKNLFYPSMYFRPAKYDSMGVTYTNKLGWRTTSLTRGILIGDLDIALSDNSIKIHSKDLLIELSTMLYNDNNDPVAASGFHDDCVFATGIAVQGFKVINTKPLDQVDYQRYLPVNFAY